MDAWHEKPLKKAKATRSAGGSGGKGPKTTPPKAPLSAAFHRYTALYCLQNGYFAPTGGIHYAPNGRDVGTALRLPEELKPVRRCNLYRLG